MPYQQKKNHLFIVFQFPFIFPLYHRYAILHHNWQKYISSLIYILIRINKRIKSVGHFRSCKILWIRTVILVLVKKDCQSFLGISVLLVCGSQRSGHSHIKILSRNLYHTCNLRAKRMCILITYVWIP